MNEQRKWRRPRDWVVLAILGAAVVGWIVLAFLDPAGNENVRIGGVVGAIFLGLSLGITLNVPLAQVIGRLAGTIWRTILMVCAWLIITFVLMVILHSDLYPTAYEAAPLATITVMLLVMAVLAMCAAPFLPPTPYGNTGIKMPFSEAGITGARYIFLQYGGLIYGLGYTIFMLGFLIVATVDPAGFNAEP